VTGFSLEKLAISTSNRNSEGRQSQADGRFSPSPQDGRATSIPQWTGVARATLAGSSDSLAEEAEIQTGKTP
jgi:hypothetical protein